MTSVRAALFREIGGALSIEMLPAAHARNLRTAARNLTQRLEECGSQAEENATLQRALKLLQGLAGGGGVTGHASRVRYKGSIQQPAWYFARMK